jgi:DNA-binding transcriptional LysR family regulator
VSRRLARLEKRLGVRLLRRTTRSLVLTDAGEALYRHARLVLEAVAQAEASVRQPGDTLRGDLRVTMPPLLNERFHALLCRFAQQHPEVRLQVHFTSKVVDLVRDGYDVAIRASMALEPGLVARTLARSELVAVASPVYLAAHGTPRTRRDLRKHRYLMGFARGELPQTHWPFAGGKLHVEGAFFSNEPDLLRQAALHDLGIALLPDLLVREDLDQGKLVRVLPEHLRASTQIAVVYPERELVLPAVRAFVDAVVAWTQQEDVSKGRPRAAKMRRARTAAPAL